MKKINGNTPSQIINELYSKSFKQKQDISDGINEIMKGTHNIGALDKVKNKISEKIENFDECLRMMEKVIFEMVIEHEKEIWKKKTENMKISCKSLVRDLEEAVNLQKKKHKGSNLFLKV